MIPGRDNRLKTQAFGRMLQGIIRGEIGADYALQAAGFGLQVMGRRRGENGAEIQRIVPGLSF